MRQASIRGIQDRLRGRLHQNRVGSGSFVLLNGVRSRAGVPLRDMLLSLYNIRRSRTATEAIWFILFMALFSTVTYTLFAVHAAFQTNDAMIDLFLDEEFSE